MKACSRRPLAERWIARSCAAMMLIVTVVTLAEPADAQSPAGANSVTANICGGLGCDDKPYPHNPSVINFGYPPGSVNDAIGLEAYLSITPTSPVWVGTQETCFMQGLHILNYLQTYEWPTFQAAGHAQRSGPRGQSACGGIGDYGVFSFAITESATNFPITDSREFDDQAPDQHDSEDRGFACINGNLFGAPYVGCSAHLSPYGAVVGGHTYNTAQEQFIELLGEEIAPRAYGASPVPVVWGGDLNMVPSVLGAVPGFTYSQNLEGDRCGGTINRPTKAPSNTKLDYAFRSGPNRACGGDAVLAPPYSDLYPGSYNSDHMIVGAIWA